GARLRPEVLAVTIAGRNIAQVVALPIAEALIWADELLTDKEKRRQEDKQTRTSESSLSESLTAREALIATPILKEVRARLSFLVDVGLSYLTLDRGATTLSGGEAQPIRRATQIGSGLMGWPPI